MTETIKYMTQRTCQNFKEYETKEIIQNQTRASRA